MQYCLNCRSQITEGMFYCPRCGVSTQGPYDNPISTDEMYKWILMISGILILVAAIFCLIFGLNSIFIWGKYLIRGTYINYNSVIVSILNIIGFIIGFKSFLYVLERKVFKFVFNATVFLIICGGFNFIFLHNISILILALIGFILLIISKDNYTVKDQEKKRLDSLKQTRAFKPEATSGQRLRELKGLLDDGVITVEEFEEKKKRLLKEL